MTWHRISQGLVGVMLMTMFGVVGCGGGKEFTPEQFATIKAGMTEPEVIAVLGKPSETIESLGTRRLFWAKSDKYYSISFTDGKVVAPMVHASKEDYDMMKGLMQATQGMGK